MKTTVIRNDAFAKRLRRLENRRNKAVKKSRCVAVRRGLPVLRVAFDGRYHYLVDLDGNRVTGKMDWDSVVRFAVKTRKFVVEGFSYDEEVEG